MSTYFERFPLVQYDVYGNNRPMTVVDISRTVRLKPSVKDNIILYTYYQVQDGERPDHVSMKLYGTQAHYWTFFMVNDNLINIFDDWTLSREELENKIVAKYAGNVLKTFDDVSTLYKKNETIVGLQSGAQAKIIQKDPSLGLIKIDNQTANFRPGEIIRGVESNSICTITDQLEFKHATHHYENTNGDIVPRSTPGASEITNSEYEQQENEKKAKIKVIKRQYINQVSEDFFKLINPEE